MTQLSESQPIEVTRDQWCEIVARQAESMKQPQIRRNTDRYSIEFGVVTTMVEGENGRVERSFSILEVSAGGLMLRGYQDLPPGANLRMIATLGDDRCIINGKVAHCTQTVGGYKIGVELTFG